MFYYLKLPSIAFRVRQYRKVFHSLFILKAHTNTIFDALALLQLLEYTIH